MESKKCNKCGKKKPINMFYKLRADKPWRRSKCIQCHREKDEINRKVRNGLYIILMLFSFSALSQPLDIKRTQVVDSINYFRENPVTRVKDAFDITLNIKKYKPIAHYKQDKALTRSAQRWAKRMARSGNYWHSRTKNAESIDAVQAWQGGYELSVGRFIVDKYVKNKGHRTHMLSWPDTLIGVGIATSKEGETYVCIQTNVSSSLQ